MPCGWPERRLATNCRQDASSRPAAHTTVTIDDYLVLCTDGVTEARRDGELCREKRLVSAVAGLSLFRRDEDVQRLLR